MNTKMTLAALAIAAASSQAVASLWSVAVPDYQVQVPCIADQSWNGDINGDGTEDYYDCAGWWYGYEFHGAFGAGTWAPKNADGSLQTTDKATGDPLPGGNLTSTGIMITFNVPAAAADDPSGAGIGFDWKNPKGAVDISAHGGYCITYALEGAPLQFELGWEEGAKGAEIKGFDSWFTTLPAAASGKSVDLNWTGGTQSAAVAGDFKKDNWDAAHAFPITDATTLSFSLKMRLKNGTASAVTSKFQIQQLGWPGECTAAVTPDWGSNAISSSHAVKSMKASLNGRSLAFSGFGKKSVTAEVISVQGQVVARQVLSAASSSMDLSKVPAGVYVVKAAGKGLSMNKMIALK